MSNGSEFRLLTMCSKYYEDKGVCYIDTYPVCLP